jgi:hypothetical protein
LEIPETFFHRLELVALLVSSVGIYAVKISGMNLQEKCFVLEVGSEFEFFYAGSSD